MNSFLFLEVILRVTAFLLFAPLLPGIINRVKAWVAGRKGPPLLQLYYDLARLWRKGIVMSQLASPGFIVGPAVTWIAIFSACLLLPLGQRGVAPGFDGDILLFLYLLAVTRFATAWAAMETGSAFEGMGAAREVSFAVLAEATVMTAVLTMSVQSGSLSLVGILAPSGGMASLLLAGGLFVVLLAENSRVPFDDPNTHLELTMIHEVMVLDHSGPPLAVILHGASMKLMLFGVFLCEAIFPIRAMSPIMGSIALAAGLVAVAVLVGLTESLTARWSFKRVPLMLTTAFILCLFALLVAWRIEDVTEMDRGANTSAETEVMAPGVLATALK